MLRTNVVLTAALAWMALAATGCSLSIDQTFAMQPGSGVDVFVRGDPGRGEAFIDRLEFEGGTVMRIDVSTSLLDYLDGTVDGDVQIVDLLFAVPDFQFIIFFTGLICVVSDDPPGGGTFSYNVLAQEATFDVAVNTKAIITNFLANLIRGGAFRMPFALEATMPMTLVDALGLFTGTGTLEVTQPVDANVDVPLVNIPDDPSQDYTYPLHVKGEVTLNTTDTFPTPPTVLACVDYLGI
jgi:hypothetical protein